MSPKGSTQRGTQDTLQLKWQKLKIKREYKKQHGKSNKLHARELPCMYIHINKYIFINKYEHINNYLNVPTKIHRVAEWIQK